MKPASRRAWLFDLDNTLHDASHAAFGMLDLAMNDYIARELAVEPHEADRLRFHYWRRYGATLLGLERHHGIRAAHFLEHTHRLPGLEERLRGNVRDRVALGQLPGRKFVLTNAPAAYARRVLGALGLAGCFEAVISIEDMRMFGALRPKPDARMLRMILARLKLPPARTVLVEDTLGHQRAARAVGLATVWMQRYLRSNAHGPEVGARLHRRPAYVCARISSLQSLRAVRLHV
ncbi:pyrimidine 5'-nucleotidase [Caldimonas sp. KR1-144]|uniref:pyrimidine 5'-nucleotidase n=1 Tax=Caldimonas sp. KR1-144 TaxID=3400911 RepID=UPI003C0FC7C6